jgi:protein-disulfide isomerase
MSTLKIGQDGQGLTRKQRREHARKKRRAIEAAQAARAVRRTRLTLLGILVSIVVAGISVVVIASAGNGEARISPGSTAARTASSEVTALLSGIPQRGIVLGRPSAPVTLQYFADLQCPVCRTFTTNALPALIQRWVRGGELKVEYRSLETATGEPEVFASQQLAALAAGKQDKLWNFVETFYREQQEEGTGYVTEGYIHGIAQQAAGLNLSQWESDRSDPALARQLAVDAQTAGEERLGGTPAFLIGRSGGTVQQLQPRSFSEAGPFDEAIEKLVRA